MATSKIKITGDNVAITFNSNLRSTEYGSFKRFGGLAVLQFFGVANSQLGSGTTLAQISQNALPGVTLNTVGVTIEPHSGTPTPCRIRIGTDGVVTCSSTLDQDTNVTFAISYSIQ